MRGVALDRGVREMNGRRVTQILIAAFLGAGTAAAATVLDPSAGEAKP